MAVDQQGELMGLLGILALRLCADGVEPASQLGFTTLDLAITRHNWPALATRTMLKTLAREVSAMQAPRRRTRGKAPLSR